MILIKDYDSFLISSLLTKLREKKYEGMLKNYGKRKIIESLFLNQAIIDNLSECPLLSSLWLKIASFYFVEGILGLNGIKSSPVHEDRVHKNLWLAKSQWLLSQGKFADCYHYIGKVGITYLLAKEERFLRRNIKVIETLLDLTSDSQTNHILHTQLVKASKDALRT